MNDHEPTNQDILEAINNFSTDVDRRFDGIDKRFVGIDKRFEKIEGDISTIKSTMVTKDYLDDKLADLRGDLVVMMRKEDTKVRMLIDILHEKKLLNEQDRNRILSMEPFPELDARLAVERNRRTDMFP